MHSITAHESAKQMHWQDSQAQGNAFLIHRMPCTQSFQEDLSLRAKFRMCAAPAPETPFCSAISTRAAKTTRGSRSSANTICPRSLLKRSGECQHLTYSYRGSNVTLYDDVPFRSHGRVDVAGWPILKIRMNGYTCFAQKL